MACRSAIAADPGDTHVRYRAAIWAVLASLERGSGSAEPGPEQRVALRRQALSWLRVAIEHWIDRKNTSRLENCMGDRYFATVRNPEALTALPQEEARQWRELWTSIRNFLAKMES